MKIKKLKGRNKTKRASAKHLVALGAMGAMAIIPFIDNQAQTFAYHSSKKINPISIASLYKRDEDSSVKRFDIAAGNLEDVLAAFERVSGWVVVIPTNDIRTVASPGVTGMFTDEEALNKILTGTGVTFDLTAPKAISLRLLGPNEQVEILAERETVASTKYTEPLRDTPQTITVIGSETIREQGATTLRDVLRNVPGLTVNAGEGGNVGGDNLTLRGFSARNDIYVDGARDLSPQSRDPFNLEQVEVVKGPTSATSGRGSTGGTVNLVSKVPTFSPTYGFDVSLGSDKTKRVTGDVNVPLARLGLGERTAFRMNAMVHDSNVAGRDVVENNRWGVAPTFTFGIGSKSIFTLSYLHLAQDNIADYGIPWVPLTNNALAAFRDRPAPVPRNTFYGFKERDDEVLKSNLATIAFSHSFNDKMSLRNQLRYGRSTRDSIATPPRFTTNVNSTVINRELRAWETVDETYDNQTDFSARFKTFGLEHALVTGAEFIREKNLRYARSAANVPTTLFNPNPNDVFTGTIYRNPLPADIVATTQSVYLIDTIKFHPKFEVNGSLRYDRYNGEGFLLPTVVQNNNPQPTARAAVAKLDNLFNYRFAAVYKPVESGSIYAAISTAVNPSLSGVGYENATVTPALLLDPEKTRTLELGTKWDLFNNRILLTGAVFSVEKTNARTPQLDGTSQILDGRQRVNGIELGITGNVTRDWNILTGYTLLDSRIVESNTLPTPVNGQLIYEVGKRFINTPRNSFNLWSTYRLPFNLNVGGGARYVDKRFGNTINTRFVDSYWLIEATASYQITKNIDIRVNGYNLGNKYYFDRLTGGHIVPGAGRSVLVGTGFRF